MWCRQAGQRQAAGEPADPGGRRVRACLVVLLLTGGAAQAETRYVNLFPSAGKQDSAAPPVSQLTLGDGRVCAIDMKT